MWPGPLLGVGGLTAFQWWPESFTQHLAARRGSCDHGALPGAGGGQGRGQGLQASPKVLLCTMLLLVPAKAPPACQHLCSQGSTGLVDISAYYHSCFSGLVASLLLCPQPPRGHLPRLKLLRVLHLALRLLAWS